MSTVSVGDRVRLASDIFDDGQDHHPPQYIGLKGDEVIVKSVGFEGSLSVAHDGAKGSFIVFADEWMPNEKAEGLR
jgi:hypothetical protein